MQIGDLAGLTGVSARSLRHYEAVGLLAPQRRGNGYRDYGPDAVERVRRIKALLSAGMHLADLGPLLSCVVDDRPTLLRCETTIAAVERGLTHLDDQIAELARIREALAAALPASS
ncbi:MerR family transcriptional regulator [Actinoplanes sp. N902-109]|uniref:MerR family transcriptional regulator n=1 Tax=Actinoplanes sp. (strain N902-109) TaxID=649831 RepID=UPI00032956AE|nr:MerR family transcriptional regulator [Actinoplanes sp. N902-109]AGL16442.1 MerR family transcriptional regulator [Actinoplanes sp. N902-109]